MRRLKGIGPYLLIFAMALLGIGTINNQLRINAANQVLREQAKNGQRALTRQCSLIGVSKKIYADMLERGKITTGDYELVFSTAQRACGQR